MAFVKIEFEPTEDKTILMRRYRADGSEGRPLTYYIGDPCPQMLTKEQRDEYYTAQLLIRE